MYLQACTGWERRVCDCVVYSAVTHCCDDPRLKRPSALLLCTGTTRQWPPLSLRWRSRRQHWPQVCSPGSPAAQSVIWMHDKPHVDLLDWQLWVCS